MVIMEIMKEKRKKYTWCDNSISGMALWKQMLPTCALSAAVTFEILSLWRSYALRETMVPLPETVLEIVFRNIIAVTLSRYVACTERQQIVVLSWLFYF
jgi:hypothetical protein